MFCKKWISLDCFFKNGLILGPKYIIADSTDCNRLIDRRNSLDRYICFISLEHRYTQNFATIQVNVLFDNLLQKFVFGLVHKLRVTVNAVNDCMLTVSCYFVI